MSIDKSIGFGPECDGPRAPQPMQSLAELFRRMDGLESKLDRLPALVFQEFQKRVAPEDAKRIPSYEQMERIEQHLSNQAALLKEIAESQGKLLAAIDALNEEARLRGASSAGHLCGVEARLKASVEKWPDTPQTELCMAKNKEGFTCNEDKGHIGWHVAHDLTHAVEAWRASTKKGKRR